MNVYTLGTNTYIKKVYDFTTGSINGTGHINPSGAPGITFFLWEFVFFSLSSFVLCRIFVSNYVVIFASFLSVWVFNCEIHETIYLHGCIFIR